MPGKKKKRKCWNCLGSHPPPTGAKCTELKVIFWEEDSWSDAPVEAEPGPCVRKSPGKPLLTDFIQQKSFPTTSPNRIMHRGDNCDHDGPEWPSLRPNGTSFPSAPRGRGGHHGSPSGTRKPSSDSFGNFNSGKPAAFEPVYRFQVTDLQEEVSLLAADSRSSQEKLSKIESLLEASLERSTARHQPAPLVKQDQARPRGRSRALDKGRFRAPRKHQDTSPSSTSPYGSSRSSSTSASPEYRYRQKSSDRHNTDKRMYKITRFLPRDERAKPLTTDKLWYCHGSFMLKQYLRGCNIEGMLRHNIFVAEKTSTRAYMSNGICRYDEAVQDRAKVDGLNSYSGGDMDLAVRFLSSEYARPKTGNNSSYGGGKQSQSRKSGQNSQNALGRDQRKNFCWMYNGSGCNFDGCKFPHICSRCSLSGHSQHTCRVSIPQGGYNPQGNTSNSI